MKFAQLLCKSKEIKKSLKVLTPIFAVCISSIIYPCLSSQRSPSGRLIYTHRHYELQIFLELINSPISGLKHLLYYWELLFPIDIGRFRTKYSWNEIF